MNKCNSKAIERAVRKSEGAQCVPGSRRFRWVEVPLDPRPWVDIQHVGVMPHGPEDVDKGFPKRARSWKRRRQPREDLSSHAVARQPEGRALTVR